MKTILAGIDLSDTTPQIVEQARLSGKAFGATVYLLHVEPPEPDFVGYGPGPKHERDHVAETVRIDRDAIHKLRDGLRQEGVQAESLIIQGPIVEKLLEEADKLEADLIIVGSHGHRALYDLLLGAVSEGVVRHASCPVLVVPSEPGKGHKTR